MMARWIAAAQSNSNRCPADKATENPASFAAPKERAKTRGSFVQLFEHNKEYKKYLTMQTIVNGKM